MNISAEHIMNLMQKEYFDFCIGTVYQLLKKHEKWHNLWSSNNVTDKNKQYWLQSPEGW